MKWLLDTNALSEGIRPRPARDVLARLAQLPVDEVAVSIVTIAELRDGAARARPEIRDAIARWIELDVMTSFRDRVLPVTIDILTDWLALARLLAAAGQPRSAADLLIAATARVHKLTVVTRNVRDFAGTGVALLDPWTGQTH